MTRVLSRIPVSEWVLRTAQAMVAAGAVDDDPWRKHWASTYFALGGTSSEVARKGCPRSAAYALWHLGWLRDSSRPLLDWPVEGIRQQLGKNAAYAVIAARALVCAGFAGSHSALWRLVQWQFATETGERPAQSDQGAVKLALGLFLDGTLIRA